jgi:acetolactate synthase-1/2/3 large subunit
MAKKVQVDSVAEAYLELLAARGIEYFFGNAGTDFAPILEAYAARFSQEQRLPKPISVPHEVTAVAMAHGYTMVTGKVQVVMVHTLPGTANATGGVINASRSNIPMLFTAGRNPLTEGDAIGSRDLSIHWAQESFDQGSMVRQWVKWDYELRSGADIEGVVDRALAITQSEPAGPVYLTLPREVLGEVIEEFSYSEEPRMAPAKNQMPSNELISQAAKILVDAQNPILITRASGRDPDTIQPLVELTETLGIPVYEAGMAYVNFPQDNPLFAGSDVASAVPEADVIVILEADVPWTPKRTGPREDSVIIAVGEDPLFSQYPVRGFRADVTLAGAPKHTLTELTNVIQGIGVKSEKVAARKARYGKAQEQRLETLSDKADAGASQTPINKAYFSKELSKYLDDDTILVSELGVDMSQAIFTKPGTAYGIPPSGGLGWGLGAALGAKLAAPEKTVICATGDGSYIFGSGTASHIVSEAQNLPVLFIVWNNGIWNAVKNATKSMHPEGYAAETDTWAMTNLSQGFNYEMVCQASGGYGERVDDPAEVPGAIQRALHAVQVEKRQALLNIIGA